MKCFDRYFKNPWNIKFLEIPSRGNLESCGRTDRRRRQNK